MKLLDIETDMLICFQIWNNLLWEVIVLLIEENF